MLQANVREIGFGKFESTEKNEPKCKRCCRKASDDIKQQ